MTEAETAVRRFYESLSTGNATLVDEDAALITQLASTRPGSRVVISWTSHVLPSGSVKEQNDP
jgi:hypothetical protein